MENLLNLEKEMKAAKQLADAQQEKLDSVAGTPLWNEEYEKLERLDSALYRARSNYDKARKALS